MTRREIRENVFKMLFRAEFYEKEELPGQLVMFEQELGVLGEEELGYLTEKCSAIIGCLEEIDGAINERATGWKTSRMGKVDLTILRLAVYEILREEEIPTKVSINEAVELAKKYGTDDSASFVNGILAKFA